MIKKQKISRRRTERKGLTPTILLNKYGLNPEQEKFCVLYATDFDYCGNGVESYVQAYGIDKSSPSWYNSAMSCASRLLRDVKVYKRINELLETMDLNDVNVDKQLAYVIGQHDDLSSKVRGIAEYNKLKKRITEKLEITGSVSLTTILDAADKATASQP